MNLIDEDWIPVRDMDGAVRRVSISTTLIEASSFRDISHASPLVIVAIHRLAGFAILQRVFGASRLEDRARWGQAGRFPPEALNAYFDRYRDRFNLFDLQRPFLQVADMTPEMSSRPWTALAAASASGNNKTLFDHSLDDAPAVLDVHDAALVLLAAQATALGGGRSAFQYTSHAPSATASLVLVEGDNLFKTLLLNLIGQTVAQHQQDIAIWEREVPLSVERMRSGPELAYRGIARNLFTACALDPVVFRGRQRVSTHGRCGLGRTNRQQARARHRSDGRVPHRSGAWLAVAVARSGKGLLARLRCIASEARWQWLATAAGCAAGNSIDA